MTDLGSAAVRAAAADPLVPLAAAARRVAGGRASRLRATLLVEGLSDRTAVEETARVLGRDLAAEGVLIVAMGGVTNLTRFLALFGPAGLELRVEAMCDAREAAVVRRSLRRAGLRTAQVHVCESDLEDELIRALGPMAAQDVVEAQGDLAAFRSLQRQPAWRDAQLHAQLRRFFGSGGGRKVRYAGLLTAALDPDTVPPPLVSAASL